MPLVNLLCYSNYEGAQDSLPVFVISLDDSPDRRKLLKSSGIPSHWLASHWSACDLRSSSPLQFRQLMSGHDFASFRDGPADMYSMFPPEVGCAQSHREVSKYIVGSGAVMGLVFEDDIQLTPNAIPADIEYKISAIAQFLWNKAAHGSAFICHLGVPQRLLSLTYKRRVVSVSSNRFYDPEIWQDVDPRESLWLAHAYIVSRGAALRYASRKIDVVADNWKRHLKLGYIDEIYLSGSPLFEQKSDHPSSIGEYRSSSRQHQHSIFDPLLNFFKLFAAKAISFFPKMF